MLSAELLRAVRAVIRADSDPMRQALFATLADARLPVRLARAVHRRLGDTSMAALFCTAYGMSALRADSPAAEGRILTLAVHANARRRVAEIGAVIGPSACVAIRTRPAALAVWRAIAATPFLPIGRVARVVRAIDRRHGFLVACRAAATIAWYGHSRGLLAATRPAAVLVSSDAHPEEAGFTGAARAMGIPQVFASHAYPTPVSAPLRFSLCILTGVAEADARRRLGPVEGTLALAGLEGRSMPMDPLRLTRERPVIGIFVPKAVSWGRLADVIDDCRGRFLATTIIVRWHPSMLDTHGDARLPGDRTGISVVPGNRPIADTARLCDWVVGDENSNVHLPVLSAGIPTVAVRGLGVYPPSRRDIHGFVAGGIVPAPVDALRDMRVEQLRDFFAGDWAERFGRYDAAYLRSADDVSRDVRHAVSDLLDSAAFTAP